MNRHKLSISNIAWGPEQDEEMYLFLTEQGFDGLEIAPTRIFPRNPYERLAEAEDFAKKLRSEYNLEISSMQSIWYGRTESLFGPDGERRFLIGYTRKAVDFAAAMNCGNLVFGCPKNRAAPPEERLGKTERLQTACSFFEEIADYAETKGTVIAVEPNPPYYGTNFINTTSEAFAFCRELNRAGLKVNVDLGTCIHYGETVPFLNENAAWINHVHISEPLLAPIEERAVHGELKKLNYSGFFSIETAKSADIERLKKTLRYVKDTMRP
jgi:sugar phosphate isomerase/epimerase